MSGVDGVDMARLIGSLLLIVLLILAVAWLLRRTGVLKAAGGPNIQILSTRHVGARQQLLVIEVDGTRMLLGANSRQLTLLHVLTEPSPVATLPVAAHPVATHSVATLPVATHPAGTYPAATHPGARHPVATNSATNTADQAHMQPLPITPAQGPHGFPGVLSDVMGQH